MCMNNSYLFYIKSIIFEVCRSVHILNYKIISKCHNSEVGHMGVDKTILRIHNWNEVKNLTEPWKHMRRNVKNFIHECEFCQKMAVLKPLIHTHPFTVASLDVFL